MLSGVYVAKVTGTKTVASAPFDVLVPQVHGTLAVPVHGYIGSSAPVVGTMGYVSFIGGDKSWPVWIGERGV